MAYRESNGHVTDDVTKRQVVNPIRLKPNIWKNSWNAI